MSLCGKWQGEINQPVEQDEVYRISSHRVITPSTAPDMHKKSGESLLLQVKNLI